MLDCVAATRVVMLVVCLTRGTVVCFARVAVLTWCAAAAHSTGRFCTLQLEINPATPRDVPIMRVLGADAVVKPMRAHLHAAPERWCVRCCGRHRHHACVPHASVPP